MKLTSDILLRWSFWAAVFQLVGTALVVWGLRITASGSGYEIDGDSSSRTEHPLAVVWKEDPRAFAVGVRLLLLGLALQVVAAVVGS